MELDKIQKKIGLKFKDKGPVGKLMHIGKACLFFLTLGFAFPNIFTD